MLHGSEAGMSSLHSFSSCAWTMAVQVPQELSASRTEVLQTAGTLGMQRSSQLCADRGHYWDVPLRQAAAVAGLIE